MRATVALLLLAAAAWGLLFAPGAPATLGFWPLMAVSVGLLTIAGLYLDRRAGMRRFHFRGAHLWIGVLSAVVLYAVFWIGHALSIRLLPGAGGEIDWVYARRAGTDPRVIAAVLLLWIGPGEEIFWRGVVQERLARRFGPRAGYLAAALCYGLVHLWARNGMLLLAALLCGLFWGWLYRRTGSLWPGIISHALWDVLIFILLPLTSGGG
jgi:membrane protease YdiL (CAAX protease family)